MTVRITTKGDLLTSTAVEETRLGVGTNGHALVADSAASVGLKWAAAPPTGSMVAWGTVSAPAGYLLCDGTAVSRTTYADLFAIISTTFGVGDGSTTFNVPNLKGRIPVGLDSAQTEFDAMAETGGAKTHTLVSGEMPSHTHTQDAHSHVEQGPNLASGGALTLGIDTNASGNQSTGSSTATTVAVNQSTGGGGSHNNLQPYLVINWVIKT